MDFRQDLPLTPFLFAGHVGLNRKRDDDVFEILLTESCLVEGLHVVPNGVSLPDFNLVGQTTPERGVRSFSLKLYGREASNSAAIVEIFDLVISGGVHWVRIPAMFQTVPFNYLAIGGDFSVLTIIVHGTNHGRSTGESSSSAPTFPTVQSNSIQRPGFISAYPKSDIEMSQYVTEILKLADGDVRSSGQELSESTGSTGPNPIVELFSADDVVKQDCDRLENIERKCIAGSIFYSKCMVSIPTIASLVESIFSVDMDAIATNSGNLSLLREPVLSLLASLSVCWKVISRF